MKSPTSPLVSPQWLSEHLSDPDVVVVDASWHMPAAGRNARTEYEAEHIEGAVFFDIDACSDQTSALPHMLPTPEAFAQYAGAMGIKETDTIVVYDSVGLFSAARGWWTFRAFGTVDVRVLDGGLPAWKKAQLPIATGPVHPAAKTFTAKPPAIVVDIDAVQSALESGSAQVVDARGAARFNGEVAEPRPGLRSGHMPGALNVPFDRLIVDGHLGSASHIQAVFAQAGLNPTGPVITTCGSGVTAAILSLGLAEIGRDSKLYDGSWSEWGGDSSRAVSTTAPKT